MKKILLIMVVLLGLGCISCAKDKSEEEKLLDKGYFKVIFVCEEAESSVDFEYSFIVEKNSKIPEPGKNDTPYFFAENNTVEGWYKDKDMQGEKWDFYKDMVEENLTLYGKIVKTD